jgi:hypothetical protein
LSAGTGESHDSAENSLTDVTGEGPTQNIHSLSGITGKTEHYTKCPPICLQILSTYKKMQQNLCVCCYCGKTGKRKHVPSPLEVTVKIVGK